MENMSEFLPYITSAVGGAAAAGAFKGPIQTFEDWWFVHFGHKSSEKAALLKAQHAANVEALKNGTLDYSTQISPKNIQEPKLNILGPALEASKYYIDEEELRDMFAKLIAASMDSSKNNITHPSFVEIIKQLTPLDASNLKVINTSPGGLPIARYAAKKRTGNGSSVIKEIVFLENKSQQNIDIQAASISNLSRLGLIEYSFVRWLTAENKYDHLLNNHITELYKDSFSKMGDGTREFDSQKGMLVLTPYGSSFSSICL